MSKQKNIFRSPRDFTVSNVSQFVTEDLGKEVDKEQEKLHWSSCLAVNTSRTSSVIFTQELREQLKEYIFYIVNCVKLYTHYHGAIKR